MSAPDDGDPLVGTPSGALRGRRRDGIVEFLGVRYARGPRFGAPQPEPAWTGVRDARVPGPISPQLPSRLGPVTGSPPEDDAVQDEDCLRVDVRAPDAPPPPGGRPVVVWLHGGAYVAGAGSLPWYDTARWVREGDVVTVNVTYRLGVFGWLYRPGTSEGNLGLLDVAAALAWVRDHVAAFGGDPGRVTAMGQSAGAHALACLLTSPSHRPLVHRAVLQSGQLGLGLSSPARARRIAGYVVDALDGADPVTAGPADLLRAQRRAMIRSAGPGGANSSPAFAPVDGVAPLAAGASWTDATAAGRDLLVGTTADESHTFVRIAPGLERVRAIPVLGRALTGLGSWVATQQVFARPAHRLADDAARAGRAVFTYRFERRAPGSDLGACHCIELPFLFGTEEAWADAPMLAGLSWDDDVEPLGARMRAAWLAFARDGDPGPDWPRHTAGDGPGMRFG